MSTKRFAEDTRVPVARSQTELKELLRKAGADQIGTFEAKTSSAVMFSLDGGMYRLDAKLNAGSKNSEQDDRRAWRMLILLTKAKLEAVRDGVTTIEREFMAARLLYDGRTVDETLTPELRIAQAEGRMPAQLLLGAPR